MENFYLILTISGIHLLALISPGPDFVMVVKNSIQYSRKIGIFTSIGFSIGILVHLFYCIVGLSLILSTNELIYNIFKILCSGYLIYMGIKSFKDNQIGNSSKKTKVDKISYLQAIKIGFLTNVLNPKVSLFFLSLSLFNDNTKRDSYLYSNCFDYYNSNINFYMVFIGCNFSHSKKSK